MEWKDATTYSKGQRGTKEPTAWEVGSGHINVWVSKGHIHHPGEWVVTCHVLGMEAVSTGLDSEVDKDTAQHCALNMADAEVRNIAREISALR